MILKIFNNKILQITTIFVAVVFVLNIYTPLACSAQDASINASIQIYPRPYIPNPTPVFILNQISQAYQDQAKYEEYPKLYVPNPPWKGLKPWRTNENRPSTVLMVVDNVRIWAGGAKSPA